MHFQRLAGFSGIVLAAGALVLAGGAQAAKRDFHAQSTGSHHFGSMRTVLQDAGTAGETGPINQTGSITGNVWHFADELHAAANDAPAQPYMMSYEDEVVQRLGLKSGNFDLISAQGGSFGLSLGGIGRNRPLLNLQWHWGP